MGGGYRDNAVSGVIWTSIGSIGGGVIQLILTMILARLLSPSDYGLLELIFVFTILSEVFVDSGFSQAVIRDKDASNVDFSSVFFFNAFVAITLYILLFFVSPLIGNFYDSPILVNLSRFVFLSILFNSLTIIQNAIFAKNISFKPQAISNISSVVLAGGISVLLAYCGFGVWALATNVVLCAFFRMFFMWMQSSWRPLFVVSLDSIKKYFKFGVNLLIQGLFDKLVSNIESLLIGKVYSKADLGYFSQARKLDSYIAQTTTSVVQKVTYPLLSKLAEVEDDYILKKGYSRVLKMTMFVMIPLMLFTCVASDGFIYIFFGENWMGSVPYLRIWSLCGLCISLYSIFINIFLVKAKTRKLLYLSLLRQVVRVLIVIFLLQKGIMVLLFGILSVTFLSLCMYVYFGGKLIKYSFLDLFWDLYKIIISSLVAAFVVYCLFVLFQYKISLFVFVIQLISMGSVYFLLMFLFREAALFEFKDILLKLLKK